MKSFLALSLFLVAGCATVAPTPKEPELPPPLGPVDAFNHGVKFLIQSQNEDGSWGSFESARPYEIWLGTVASFRAFHSASTALCCLALQEVSRTNPDARKSLDRGLAYLLKAEPAARATGETFYDTWAHTYMVQSLTALYQDNRFAAQRDLIREALNREIRILGEHQSIDGGWGYYDFGNAFPNPTGHESTSFNTAAAVVALQDAQQAGVELNPDMIHDGLKCLERLRLPGGSFIYGTYAQNRPAVLFNRVKGSLGRSMACNFALWRMGRDITKDEMIESFANLRDFHHFIEIGKGRPYPHEAWYYTAGYYFMFGHYYASRDLDALEGKEREEYAKWLAGTMARLQDPDGSWFDFPFYGYHKFYGTAYGLLTLQNSLSALERPSELRPGLH